MSDDKLREAAELVCVSASLASDGGVGQFLKALSDLRAALADSGTIKGRLVGEAPDFPVVMDFEDAPTEPTEEIVDWCPRCNAPTKFVDEDERRCFHMYCALSAKSKKELRAFAATLKIKYAAHTKQEG